MTRFRPATRDDVPAIVALLSDDELGATRESADMAPYLAAFDALADETGNHLIVGQDDTGRIVATYQITFVTGLSLQAARRAQIESVRVVSDLRGTGLGALMVQDAETRARAAGCRVLQLTTHASRTRAQAFYKRMGFTPSHVGFKRDLT